MAPREKHWWHVGLRIAAAGLTTTPIRAGDRVFELILNLTDHRLDVVTNRGEREEIFLQRQSVAAFYATVLEILGRLKIQAPMDRAAFADTAPGAYDKAALARFWQALPLIDAVLKQLKSEHRGESGPVQLWPHHFDLALLMFTGRRVPGVDPANEESADEQMTFGFVTGDAGIAEPYFYATAYPVPPGLTDAPTPHGANWHTQDWTGAVMPYASLRSADDPAQRLLQFFRAVRDAGFGRMK